MAILNYGNQFKYSGKGYIDSKMTPVKNVEDLETTKSVLSSLYTPGMKVMVLNDEPFGACEYFLTENYEWKRVIDIDSLHLSLDKGNYDSDDTIENLLQLHYTSPNGELVALGEPIDLSVLLTDVEKRLDVLENKEDVSVEDTNTFVEQAEIVTENKGTEGLFIKFTYNDGNEFFCDITALEPKVYSQGIGILIGEDNVISINKEWFDGWFDEKIIELSTKLSDLEKAINEVDGKVVTLSDNLNAISGRVGINEEAIATLNTGLSGALSQIAENKIQIGKIETTANEASSKANENEVKIKTLSEQLAKIRGVEYIKAGENISVTEGEEGYITISANVETVDTSAIKERLDVVETIVSGHTSDIASLQDAIKNLTPDGEGLSGDNVTIKTNEQGSLSVMISSDNANAIEKKNDGLFVQTIDVVLGDEEINADENN